MTAERRRRDVRHRGREAALQMLYQWELTASPIGDIAAVFWAVHGPERGLTARGREFADRLLQGTVADLGAIDPLIAEAAVHWRLERMALVDRLILRLAVFELRHEPETPAPVVINEALELARTFGGDESVGFINGVLDGVRKRLEARAAQDA